MGTCQGCGAQMKMIPAGVSKTTGRPYQAFEACSAKCGFKPARAQARQTYGQPAPQPQIGVANDMLHELQEIKAILLLINSKMPKKSAPVQVDGPSNAQDEIPDNIDDQLEPDSDVPF